MRADCTRRNPCPLCTLSSICHSFGLNLLTRNRTMLTARYEKTMHSQMCVSSGSMNEKTAQAFHKRDVQRGRSMKEKVLGARVWMGL